MDASAPHAIGPVGVAGLTASVLLRHRLPRGGWHFDWMIEDPGRTESHRLWTFRTLHDPMTSSGWLAQRTADHRAHYLSFEGDLGGGRGSVTRVWRVVCRTRVAGDAGYLALGDGLAGDVVIRGRCLRGPVWQFCRGGDG